jgi:carbonic anhydrase/acetyltransferase-like protein (isoleucine patch superfamily)
MIKSYRNFKPKIHSSCYVSKQSLVIGKVILDKDVSVWPGCVLRGDIEDITVRQGSNLQDGVLVHTNYDLPVFLDKGVTVGHGAVLHGCRIGKNCLIGMKAVILDGAVIGDNCIIGAGAVVTENSCIDEKSLVLGVPGRVIRQVNDEEIEKVKKNALDYMKFAKVYKNAEK